MSCKAVGIQAEGLYRLWVRGGSGVKALSGFPLRGFMDTYVEVVPGLLESMGRSLQHRSFRKPAFVSAAAHNIPQIPNLKPKTLNPKP